MRIPFIAANWKMHKTVHESVVFVKEFRSMVKDIVDVEIVVAPPFTALHAVAEAARVSVVGVGAQNLHWEREGAFTGEISAGMLREAGAEYVIIGHSERRRLFHETDETVNRKLLAALDAKLTLDRLHRRNARGARKRPDDGGARSADPPGSGRAERRTDRRARGRVRARLGDRDGTECHARTGGRSARAHPRPDARRDLAADAAEQCHVIYGGSVKADNIHELMLSPDVDGALVGGASLDVRGFFDIVARSRQSAV